MKRLKQVPELKGHEEKQGDQEFDRNILGGVRGEKKKRGRSRRMPVRMQNLNAEESLKVNIFLKEL